MTDRWPDDPVSGRFYLSAIDPREVPVTSPIATPTVEWKVKAATAASYVGGVVGLAILQVLSDGSLLSALPEPYTTLLAPLIPAIVTFVASYLTAHSPRASGLGADVDASIAERVQVAVDDAVSRIPASGASNGKTSVVTDGEVHS